MSLSTPVAKVISTSIHRLFAAQFTKNPKYTTEIKVPLQEIVAAGNDYYHAVIKFDTAGGLPTVQRHTVVIAFKLTREGVIDKSTIKYLSRHGTN